MTRPMTTKPQRPKMSDEEFAAELTRRANVMLRASAERALPRKKAPRKKVTRRVVTPQDDLPF